MQTPGSYQKCTGPRSQILDVGSGAGEFCIVGALSTEAQFIGVERRQALAEYSRSWVNQHGIPRVSIIEGDACNLDWEPFDGIYLFNPFYENVVNQDRFHTCVRRTQEKLRELRPGTRVVTYHGFGGEPPHGYRLIRVERFREGSLQLWIKQVDQVTALIPPVVWQEADR